MKGTDNGLYRIRKLRENVWMIDEAGLDCMYIVKGRSRALVVDTGTGIASFRTVVEKMVQGLAYDVVLTHGHRDHAGGAGEFDTVRIIEEDIPLLRKVDAESRREYVEKMVASGAADSSLLEKCSFSYADRRINAVAIPDGYTFSPGDNVFCVIRVPGHTEGECCLIDRKNNILFAGDAANPVMILRDRSMDRKSVMARWLDRLDAVNSIIDDDTLVCAGHGLTDRKVISSLLDGGKAYLEGKKTTERVKIHFFDGDAVVCGENYIFIDQ